MSGTWNEDPASSADDNERRVKLAALDSFHSYERTAHRHVTHRRRQNFYALPAEHWRLLSGPPFCLLEKFDRVDEAIDANGRIAREIVRHSFDAFGIEDGDEDEKEDGDGVGDEAAADVWRDTAKPSDVDKARSTIRQFFRDWSAEGAGERRQCYGPVLAELCKLHKGESERDGTRVLVPGAGLGRLVVEICALGFEVEGNELSFHQLMASNWMLNGTRAGERFDLYPWALSFSNQVHIDRQLDKVVIPDVHPGTYLHESSQNTSRHAFERLSMSAADFCALYAQADQHAAFNAVVTVFFIDTSPNLIRYLEALRNTLKPGGHWINLGPLLWHFEDRTTDDTNVATSNGDAADAPGIEEAGSVELTADEVRALVVHMGFEIEMLDVSGASQSYLQQEHSMMSTAYRVMQFTAVRT